MPDEPSLGEISRRLDRLEVRVDGRVVSLNTYQAERTHDRDEVDGLRREMTQLRAELAADVTGLRGDVKEIGDRISTAFRLAVTGIVAPIIVGVVLWLINQAQ